jgi:hypothetical protein
VRRAALLALGHPPPKLTELEERLILGEEAIEELLAIKAKEAAEYRPPCWHLPILWLLDLITPAIPGPEFFKRG